VKPCFYNNFGIPTEIFRKKPGFLILRDRFFLFTLLSKSIAEKLHQIADTQQWISGALLLQLAVGITQVIDGKFQGNRLNENQPWLTITAVDSSAYDIESLDENIIAQMRQQFQQVSELPILLNA
jgi:hypothetical protein